LYAVCGAAWVSGIVLLFLKGEQGRRVILALLPAIGPPLILGAAFVFSGGDLWRMTVPLLFAGAVFGIRLILGQLGRLPMLYPAAFALAALMLLQNQIGMRGEAHDRMSGTAAENGDLVAIAAWVRSHTGSETRLFSDRPALLTYYSERIVASLPDSGMQSHDLVIAPRKPGAGFIAVYRLPSSPDESGMPGTGYAVWRKE
jgi:hypothetical protein